jgi:hypothetical protein
MTGTGRHHNGGIPRTERGAARRSAQSGGNDLSQINAAITACTAGHCVLLGLGTFTISGSAELDHEEASLRAPGPHHEP